MKNIQKRLGHSKLATTMDTYSHVTQKMEQDIINIFENIIATQKQRPVANKHFLII